MDNRQVATYKQHSTYAGMFIGLGVGIFVATLFWYLLAPASLFGASLVTGAIITALGVALHFIPAESADTLEQQDLDRTFVNEAINEWRSQEAARQQSREFDY